jgi:hypothetical protein
MRITVAAGAAAAIAALAELLAELPAWLVAIHTGLLMLLAAVVLLADRPAERLALVIAALRGNSTAPALPRPVEPATLDIVPAAPSGRPGERSRERITLQPDPPNTPMAYPAYPGHPRPRSPS